MLDKFLGARLREVELVDFSWFFAFSSEATVATESIWRVVTEDQMALSSEDHDQLFGRGEPMDAAGEALGLLGAGTVRQISLTPITSDLVISFTGGVELQFLNTSCGYEGWRATIPGEGGGEIIQMGGGELAIINT